MTRDLSPLPEETFTSDELARLEHVRKVTRIGKYRLLGWRQVGRLTFVKWQHREELAARALVAAGKLGEDTK